VLEELLSKSGPNEKQEAILFHVSHEEYDLNIKNNPRSFQSTVTELQMSQEFHKKIQANIFKMNDKINENRLDLQGIGNGVLPIVRAQLTSETVLKLAEIPEVTYIMPDYEARLIKPFAAVNDLNVSASEKNAGVTWGLERLEIPKLWEITKGGGVNVAVIDTGVDSKHIVLKDRVKKFVSITKSLRRREQYTSGYDGGSHGTHVCGTICGGKALGKVFIGVAPHANLFVAAVPTKQCQISHLMDGFSWAIEKGADIINISYEARISSYYDYSKQSMLINTKAKSNNAVLVAAIGNCSYGAMGFPGNSFGSFSVGAIFEKKGGNLPLRKWGAIADFSGGASLEYPGGYDSKKIVKPDVVAPGCGVYSCIPSKGFFFRRYPFACMDGTSMAAPHVAGAIALLKAAHPKALISDILKSLEETADHPEKTKRPDNWWGQGLIQPFNAHKVLK